MGAAWGHIAARAGGASVAKRTVRRILHLMMESPSRSGPDSSSRARPSPEGLSAFIADVSQLVARGRTEGHTTASIVDAMADRYAYIRPQDLHAPARFFRQMAGAPPVQFGTQGFRRELVDDLNPARHYTAFLWIGFWLPHLLALTVLWAWEIAGFVRYRGYWSWQDIASGRRGILHGKLVRSYGATILPGLIAHDLADIRAAVSNRRVPFN